MSYVSCCCRVVFTLKSQVVVCIRFSLSFFLSRAFVRSFFSFCWNDQIVYSAYLLYCCIYTVRSWTAVAPVYGRRRTGRQNQYNRRPLHGVCVYHFYIYTVDESLFSRCSQQHSHKQWNDPFIFPAHITSLPARPRPRPRAQSSKLQLNIRIFCGGD